MIEKVFSKYECIKQHDITDCAAACLATISKHYGLKIPITKIREIAGTDKQGTNAYGLIKAAEKMGFSAGGFRSTPEEFYGDFELPAIAHVVVDGSLLHYVVVHKITRQEIIVADPAKGIVKYKPEDFFKIWSGILIIIEPTTEFEKGDQTKNIFTRFFYLLKLQKNLLAQIFIISVIVAALGIVAALYFQFLLDDIIPRKDLSKLNFVSMCIVMLYVLKIFLNAVRTRLLIYFSQKIDLKLILGYYHHVLDLPMNFFGTRKTGEIISRFNDASKVREAISGAALSIMIDTLMALVGGIILYRQNPAMFFIAFLIVIAYAITVTAFNKPIEKANRKQMEDNAQLTSYLVESINGVETIKAFNAERKVKTKTHNSFTKLLKSIFKSSWIATLEASCSEFVSTVGGIIILWVGAYNVTKGTLTIGELLAFNALLVYFLDPIKNLINLQPMMQTAIVASDRLGEILDLTPEKTEVQDKKVAPESLKGDIELKNVNFRYGTRDLILKDISLKIQGGERIALVGSSGSGKTTLAKLLLNFYQCESGEILINGHNIQDIKIEQLRKRTAYISQKVFLFSGTIKENLEFALEKSLAAKVKIGKTIIEKTGMEELMKIAEMTKTNEFIMNSPLGYETMLEEDGTNLSGGQRQRLAITRALLKKPDILIMDEATSNLDSITEKAIESTIEQITENVTTIIIAHRLSTIKSCDRIYVMEAGTIAECGTHEELLEEKGRYWDLWKGQLIENTKKRARFSKTLALFLLKFFSIMI